MVYDGVLCMVYGVYGVWCMVYGVTMVYGRCSTTIKSRSTIYTR
jgi:hypothetical protein